MCVHQLIEAGYGGLGIEARPLEPDRLKDDLFFKVPSYIACFAELSNTYYEVKGTLSIF